MAYLALLFFRLGYRKLHPFGKINLIITSELTFHTRTAGLYLGQHLIQTEIFLVCFSQPISLLEVASTYYDGLWIKCRQMQPSKLSHPRQCHKCHACTKGFVGQIDNSAVYRQALTFVYGHRICQNKWKLLSVDINVFHDHKFSQYFVYVVIKAHSLDRTGQLRVHLWKVLYRA